MIKLILAWDLKIFWAPRSGEIGALIKPVTYKLRSVKCGNGKE